MGRKGFSDTAAWCLQCAKKSSGLWISKMMYEHWPIGYSPKHHQIEQLNMLFSKWKEVEEKYGEFRIKQLGIVVGLWTSSPSCEYTHT